MGLAVYNSIILDIRFPAICYKKLLSPAVVPYNNPRATVGVTQATIEDLAATKQVSSIYLYSLISLDLYLCQTFFNPFNVMGVFNKLSHIFSIAVENKDLKVGF